MTNLRKKITEYIAEQYGVAPEFPWEKYDSNAVFRHQGNKKWFALIMDVKREVLGPKALDAGSARKKLPDKDEVVSVINLKIDDVVLRDMLISEKGILPAYHMNKLHWVTVLLDGSVPESHVHDLLDESFRATMPSARRKKDRPAKEWIVPANPKYYDVESAFEKADVIDWKQGSGINVGDTVFLYVGAPVSAILYKCKVLETDIPYSYQDANLTIKSLMKIKLLKRYDREAFTFAKLNDEYGIFAVRGPRGVPNHLSSDLKK